MRSVLSLAALCLLPLASLAAPPETPAPITVKVGRPVVFDVKPDGAKDFGFAPGFDPAKCPVLELRSRPGQPAKFFAIPTEAGTYYVTFWTVGETAYSQLVITATADDGTIPPPKKPNPPTDPPAPATSLYFLIVRPDGPASAAFTQTMSLPEWATLSKAGHNYKDKTATEAAALGVRIPAGTALPAVVVLRTRADGKSDQLLIAPFPTTGEGVTALPSLVK